MLVKRDRREAMVEFLQHVGNGLVIGGGYALIGIGLTMILGIMNVVNFAHGELYMLGAYFLFSLTRFLGLNFFVALILSMLGVMAIGFLIEKSILRPLRNRSLDMALLATIGLSIFLQNLARFIWTPVPQMIQHPFPPIAAAIGPVRITELRLFAALVALACIVLTHLLVKKTRLGKAMRATFQDREIAALLGIRVDRIYSFTFGFGSALAAVAGTLLGTIFVLKPTMGDFAIVKAFAVVILGGMGSFPGAILGGLILGVAENLGAAYISSGYKDVIAFALIIFILILKPSGLLGKRK
jgi:branched-chain amino acid transport system permease protein